GAGDLVDLPAEAMAVGAAPPRLVVAHGRDRPSGLVVIPHRSRFGEGLDAASETAGGDSLSAAVDRVGGLLPHAQAVLPPHGSLGHAAEGVRLRVADVVVREEWQRVEDGAVLAVLAKVTAGTQYPVDPVEGAHRLMSLGTDHSD